MKSRYRLLLIAVVVLLVLVALTYPLWSPYFINIEVDEAFPAAAEAVSMTDETQDADAAMLESDTTPEAVNNADSDAQEPVALYAGEWIEIDAVHGAQGTATIYQVGEQRVVRFEDFHVTNGPDLHIVLAKNVPTGILDGVGEDYVDLGALKGNVGCQNYDIPADVDLAQFYSVVVYCVPFHVVFSSAALSAI